MKTRLFKAITIASLLLNVLLVGAFATRWFRHSFTGGPASMAQASGAGLPLFRATVHAAGGPLDARVRAVFRQHVHDARSVRGDVFRARKQVEAELGRDPFHGPSATKALVELARVEGVASARANLATVELLGHMNAVERAKVRAFFDRPPKLDRGPTHHGRPEERSSRQPEP